MSDELDPVLVHHIVNTLGWPSLRPLQEQAIAPVSRGDDALLLAPTAGGKTEAALFPLLTRASAERWSGLSILYVCPLRALLNNLEPRVDGYTSWLGRRAQLWHGDTAQGQRQRILRDPPDILLTTPESLEAMLVSTKVDAHELFSGVQAIVVDEVHAFAGDDRGWHLLSVLERIERLAGHPIQRVGLSATVGNPDELISWLQGSHAGKRPATVIAPGIVSAGVADAPPPGEVTLDFVGSLDNAATVIAQLHRGEKRLVFCESRRAVEELAGSLRQRDITTFVSHSSLSRDERHRAEQAFAEARDCVIVSTSTLELGIDVGDLDRMIQIDSPSTVASFLQRIGRTGRRDGATRNALFLATTPTALLQAAGLLHLWSSGFVERIAAPPNPRHIVAQQVLALCLQEHRVGRSTWREWWGGLEVFGPHMDTEEIVSWLIDEGFLELDGGMMFIGPEAERRFGRRNFMDLVAVFTASPEFTVVRGREELGSVDPSMLTVKVDGPRIVLLAGRSWRVTHIDWKRKRCFVEASDIAGRSKWFSAGLGLGYRLCQAQREVLLGSDPRVTISRRASDALAEARDRFSPMVSGAGSVVFRESGKGDVEWWTWAGTGANATLAAALGDIADPVQSPHAFRIRLSTETTPEVLADRLRAADVEAALPEIRPEALRGLKFSAALPEGLAIATLASRVGDTECASRVVAVPRTWVQGLPSPTP
ncbi:DEAD/DEAH box helicase [Demequina muriae]|uniref:DEAD/DEAH box helicase n=1 Tax=Demequina muriae TaxID=3051664 RepID=A0ABT8GE65_9MICO|nr:DEAD/DEAH box helicase [Demequina sp. EGI L300058]MDN4479715.1 DEAD/DEAH box helicase [Demequina sp. EGI L300058]